MYEDETTRKMRYIQDVIEGPEYEQFYKDLPSESRMIFLRSLGDGKDPASAASDAQLDAIIDKHIPKSSEHMR